MNPDSLYTFAVIADTHIEPEDVAGGDVPRSNGRTRHVVDHLNRLNPDFVVHLGDIVHPTPFHPRESCEAGRRAAREMLAGVRQPLYLAAGNHDVGDKANELMPGKCVRQGWLDEYDQVFGEQFYSFDHKDHHFIVLNNCIFNSGLPLEEAQRTWLERDLAGNAGRRIFAFYHYPNFLLDPRERSNYENVNEPARSWILGLFEKYRVEATFAGHVHFFFFNQYGNTYNYALPSTSRVRGDFSEIFTVGPAAEYGVNDAEKLGFFLVHVGHEGHATSFVRTHGVEADLSLASSGADRIRDDAAAYVGRFMGRARMALGVQLHHPLIEAVRLQLSSTLDWFQRKTVSNDYPTLTIWDLSLRKLRIVAGDLQDELTRNRTRTLVNMGCEFTVVSAGVPDDEIAMLLKDNADLIHTLEVDLPGDRISASAKALRRLKGQLGCRLTVAKVEYSYASNVHNKTALIAATYAAGAIIEADTREAELNDLRAILGEAEEASAIDGFVFRIDPDKGIVESVSVLADVAAAANRKTGVAIVRLAPEQTYFGAMRSEAQTAGCVAEAFVAACRYPQIDVFVDTFADVDRGPRVRGGLVDPRYNYTMAGNVLRHLQRIIEQFEAGLTWTAPRILNDAVRVFAGEGEAVVCALVVPTVETADVSAADIVQVLGRTGPDGISLVDLSTGVARNFDAEAAGLATEAVTHPVLAIAGQRAEETNAAFLEISSMEKV